MAGVPCPLPSPPRPHSQATLNVAPLTPRPPLFFWNNRTLSKFGRPPHSPAPSLRLAPAFPCRGCLRCPSIQRCFCPPPHTVNGLMPSCPQYERARPIPPTRIMGCSPPRGKSRSPCLDVPHLFPFLGGSGGRPGPFPGGHPAHPTLGGGVGPVKKDQGEMFPRSGIKVKNQTINVWPRKLCRGPQETPLAPLPWKWPDKRDRFPPPLHLSGGPPDSQERRCLPAGSRAPRNTRDYRLPPTNAPLSPDGDNQRPVSSHVPWFPPT